jgi:hypothetical protein
MRCATSSGQLPHKQPGWLHTGIDICILERNRIVLNSVELNDVLGARQHPRQTCDTSRTEGVVVEREGHERPARQREHSESASVVSTKRDARNSRIAHL